MHELSVSQSILNISLEYAKEAGAVRITDINLLVGQLSSIVDDSVQFYWDIVAAGTIAEGARLHFHRVPAEMTCSMCQHVYHPGDSAFECPCCGSSFVRITKGEEFLVDSIDVE